MCGPRLPAVAGIKAEAPFPHMLKRRQPKYWQRQARLALRQETARSNKLLPRRKEAKQTLQTKATGVAFADPGRSRSKLTDAKQLETTSPRKPIAQRNAALIRQSRPRQAQPRVEKLIASRQKLKKIRRSRRRKNPGPRSHVVSDKPANQARSRALIAAKLRRTRRTSI